MDADGNIIGKPAERTVASFDRTRELLDNYYSLLSRKKGGEKGLEFDLFVAEYRLEKLSSREVLNKLDSFKDLTEEQQAVASQIRIDEKVKALIQQARDDEDAIAGVSAQLLEILDSGKLPSKGIMLDFWAVLAHTAQKNQDADLLRRCIEQLRKDFSERKDVQDWANNLERKLKTFD